jgi:hypothetical protein
MSTESSTNPVVPAYAALATQLDEATKQMEEAGYRVQRSLHILAISQQNDLYITESIWQTFDERLETLCAIVEQLKQIRSA